MMTPRSLPRWLLIAFCVMPLLAWAGERAAVSGGDEPRTRLSRMHQAATERNYQGTMVFSAGGVVSSSTVAHFRVGEQSFERIEALDGRMQRIYRHNAVAHTVWPQAGVAIVEKRDAMGMSASLMQTIEPRALEQYELRDEGRDRVAGRDAEVFVLLPRDEWRYMQRLWADLASGLMLRADVIGAGKNVLESSAFSQIDIGIKPQPESVLQPLRRLNGYKLLQAQHAPAQLEAEGWVMNRALPGFRLSSCVKRPLQAVAAGEGKPTEPVIQAVFSDGLTHVSLFVERFDAARHRKDVQGQLGATSTLMQRRGEHWLTAMGDVPSATLRFLLESLERRR